MQNRRNDDKERNPIARGYNAFDCFIMKGVNKGVRGWNWLTGETKSQLANKFVAGFSIAFASAGLMQPDPTTKTLTILTSSCGIPYSNLYERLDNMERSAKDSGALDMEVEQSKSVLKVAGPYGLAFSAMFFRASTLMEPRNTEQDFEQMFWALFGFGMGSYGVSNYVMRADPVNPRKDCIRRGIKKLSEIVSEYNAGQQLQPMPSLIPN